MKKIWFLYIKGVFILVLLLASIAQVSAYSNELDNKNSQVVEQPINDYPEIIGPDWYYKPANYAELVGWYQSLESTYPDYLEVFKANELYETGQAAGGYDLYYVRITNESLGLHKPEVLFLGSPHGDEVVGGVGLYWFTDWLMRMAFTDETHEEFTKDYLQWLINNREIYIEVLHNPYGYDHGPQRYDGNGWDLNREADMDGPGSPTGGIWGSENGKTLVEFINNHLCRIGCDFHGGARMLLYPWGSTHSNVVGTSSISGYSYNYAPPDFYFFDASSLRVGSYMGDYGGNLNANNIGTIPDTVGYIVYGGICPWGYGADVVKNPVEDPYVEDEIFGNYPGAGLLWLSPEMSNVKNVPESDFGNDTVHRYGAEVRRFVLHQTDLAQPYVRFLPGTVENNSEYFPDAASLPFRWQVNGSLVVDHTYIQWGTDPDPINNWLYTTTDYNEHEGDYLGGTGWDDAEDGQTDGVTYEETIVITEPEDYYFVVKAQVDQVYKDVLEPDVYGDDPYLRLIKERTDDDYYESLEGTDGTEEIIGQTWWYSPIIHVTVMPDTGRPEPPTIEGSDNGRVGKEYEYTIVTTEPDGEDVYYYVDWGDGYNTGWIGPYPPGEPKLVSHAWNDVGDYTIKAQAKDIIGAKSLFTNFPVHIGIPVFKIDTIKGGLFKVKTVIKNIGDAEADDINWQITLEGGTIFLGRTSQDVISTVPPNGEVEIKSNLIFGFGDVRVKAIAETPEAYTSREQGGQVFLIWIKVNPGG